MNMTIDTVYQVSLIAAYVAGMVALFAPCCISYLLPAYLGNVFKEKKDILLMTFIYSLGIFTVLFPIVVGAKILSNFFFQYHDPMYLLGGGLMVLVSFLSLIGMKLPMPHLTTSRSGHDPLSTYILGIMSGVTSACCAPVLIGVITLSTLTPSIFQAIIVGVMYVLGMVTPLYLAGMFIHKRNILKNPVLKKKVATLRFGTKVIPIFMTNLVAFGVFFITGWLLIYLTLLGKLGMDEKAFAAARNITRVASKVTEMTQSPILNIGFGIVMVLLLMVYFKSLKQGQKVREVTEETYIPTCCQSKYIHKEKE